MCKTENLCFVRYFRIDVISINQSSIFKESSIARCTLVVRPDNSLTFLRHLDWWMSKDILFLVKVPQKAHGKFSFLPCLYNRCRLQLVVFLEVYPHREHFHAVVPSLAIVFSILSNKPETAQCSARVKTKGRQKQGQFQNVNPTKIHISVQNQGLNFNAIHTKRFLGSDFN